MASEQPLKPGRVIARLARQLEVALAGVDLTPSQYRILGILDDGRGAASVLADKLAVSRPSVTGVVDGLVLRGLVERHPEGGDRRRIGLDLTNEGRRLLAGADAELERRLDEIAGQLPPDAEREAFAALASWREALDSHRACRHRPAAPQPAPPPAPRRVPPAVAPPGALPHAPPVASVETAT